MKVLSLFDGCGMTYQALKNLNVKVDKYYASEIDKYAIQIAKKNHPDLIELGDVTSWRDWQIEKPDLIVAGSPCQGFSFAGKQLNFNDKRSALFFEFVNILKHYKPKYFLLENVKMKKEYQDTISDILGVDQELINSSLVSAQNRKRIYWCNWELDQPEDRGIFLKDILQPFKNIDESFYHSQKAIDYMERGNEKWQQAGKRRADRYTQTRDKEKAFTLTANFWKGVPYNYFKDDAIYRKLTPIECERLQTLPDNYTEGVSNSQRYRMLGNGFTVKVIEHILKKIVDQTI